MRDVSRLIEFKTDLDVIGNQRLHPRQFRFDSINDIKSGSIGPLGYRDVNRPAAIYQAITGQNVAAVLHRADVAHKNRWATAGADRKIGEFANLRDNRVDRGDAIQITRTNIS